MSLSYSCFTYMKNGSWRAWSHPLLKPLLFLAEVFSISGAWLHADINVHCASDTTIDIYLYLYFFSAYQVRLVDLLDK